MTPLRRLALAAYILAAVLIASTVLDLLQAAWPFRVEFVNWRVLVIGALARILAAPLLGLILALGAAVVLEQPRALRALAVLNFGLAAVIPFGLVVYAMDVFQLRAQVTQGDRSQYDMGVFVSFSRYALGFVALVGMGWAAWSSARSLGASSRSKADAEAGGLVFQAAGRTRGAGPDAAAPGSTVTGAPVTNDL